MTCDPVAGFVQVPCIERCAFGAVKAWTGFMIASNEIPANRRVDFDTTVDAMALTAKEMNSKYKETSEGGLAVSAGALLATDRRPATSTARPCGHEPLSHETGMTDITEPASTSSCWSGAGASRRADRGGASVRGVGAGRRHRGRGQGTDRADPGRAGGEDRARSPRRHGIDLGGTRDRRRRRTATPPPRRRWSWCARARPSC